MKLKIKNTIFSRFEFCVFVFLFSFFVFSLPSVFAESVWQELKGDHFIIFHAGDEAYARDVLRQAERYYDQIASDLGYARYSNFWQWDKRVKIFVYPSKNDFLVSSGQPSWSMGNANYTDKTISSFSGSPAFLQGILPHEIAHLIFRDFVGFPGSGGSVSQGNSIPLWIDEGVAQRQEPAKQKVVKYYVRLLYDQKKLLSFRALMNPEVLAMASDEEVRNFYIQSASLVGFLIEHYGADNFVQFCRQLRDGKSLEEAIRFSYTSRLSSLDDLENVWLAYVAGIQLTVKPTFDVHGKLLEQEVVVREK